MVYIVLYIMAGLATAFFDRSYIKYNAIDWAMQDYENKKLAFVGKAFNFWCTIYFAAICIGEVFVWPYTVSIISLTRIRKFRKNNEESITEDTFY